MKAHKYEEQMKSQIPKTLLLTGLSYLLGSIPFSYLVARAKGVDLRKVGSGNIGSANVWRACGAGAFAAAMSGDMLKGAAMPAVAKHTLHMSPVSVVVIGSGAMLGHTYPIFMHFKGGKAVATTGGVLLVIFPLSVGIGATVWGSMLALTRISSVSSLSAAVAVLLATIVKLQQKKLDPAYAAFIFMAGAAIIFLHRSNIQRLIEGRENKFKTFR